MTPDSTLPHFCALNKKACLPGGELLLQLPVSLLLEAFSVIGSRGAFSISVDIRTIASLIIALVVVLLLLFL